MLYSDAFNPQYKQQFMVAANVSSASVDTTMATFEKSMAFTAVKTTIYTHYRDVGLCNSTCVL